VAALLVLAHQRVRLEHLVAVAVAVVPAVVVERVQQITLTFLAVLAEVMRQVRVDLVLVALFTLRAAEVVEELLPAVVQAVAVFLLAAEVEVATQA
jgi:hypothetical protein